jgi:hypothetical protein
VQLNGKARILFNPDASSVIAPSAKLHAIQESSLKCWLLKVTKPAPKAAACCLVMTISISIQVGEALIEFHCQARPKSVGDRSEHGRTVSLK